MTQIDPAQERIISDVRQWIVQRLKTIRETRGFSQNQVAERMGVTVSRVCDLEKGINDYKVSTMLRAAWALGISPEVLMRGCPGFNSKLKRLDPVVIAPASQLVEALVAAGLEDRKAQSLIQGILHDAGNP